MHQTNLIATIAFGLCAALLFGLVARRIGLSPIIGYMIGGIAVGPHTPGFVADHALSAQLAEIGVALLMFGVGLHFSLRDLLAVRRIAVPGAIAQSAAATLLGLTLGLVLGWGWLSGLVFGLALSVASTVVLIRGLEDVRELHTLHGHVAVGWLIVEDLFTVLILVLLPALAATSTAGLGTTVAVTMLKVLGLVAIYGVGVRLVPWLLGLVALLRSRELFTLSVLAIALGVAYGSAEVFGVSMALGAFMGGMVVGQSDLSHRAAADALPLRDAFAVLFFVSVGMLFDPGLLLDQPFLLLSTTAIILLAKPVAALLITLLVGYPPRTGLVVAAGLAQIGEFSFILGGLALELGLIHAHAHSALVAAALLTTAVNPLLFRLAEPAEQWLARCPGIARWLANRPGTVAVLPADVDEGALRGHVVLCGYGRVGNVLGNILCQRGLPFLVIDQNRSVVQTLRRDGITAINGDAANPVVLERAHLNAARMLIVTIPDTGAIRLIIHNARQLNSELAVVARAHQESERQVLNRFGNVDAVLGELELALEMARQMLHKFGVSTIEAQAVALDYRRADGSPDRSSTRVIEVQVTPDSRACGKRLADLVLGQGVLVMAVNRGSQLMVPDGKTELQRGDTLLIIADRGSLGRVQEYF